MSDFYTADIVINIKTFKYVRIFLNLMVAKQSFKER